tara:strand:- start:664 stop:1740 length:1077 start_codon:yes stop_codon:yes gene_type:complete
MKIEEIKLSVRELSKGFVDNEEQGVFGYGGKLDIRPPYQREFVYKDKQRDAVINTIIKNFPLNIMYWAVRDEGGYEIIDGQQRTISICRYISGDFSYEKRYFNNLQTDEQNQILDYKLTIYQCTGTDSEKLEWFKTINIAGEELYDQELRNAVYHGPWVSDAKKYFSKNGCAAYGLGSDYLRGSPIRQQYLETTISWINSGLIDEYMAKHQNKPTAIDLWNYFQSVIAWVKATFPNKRKKMMQGLPWGEYYNAYKNHTLDPKYLEEQIIKLIADKDVDNNRGIYLYLLSGEEKHLNIRKFDDEEKQRAYEKQKGICTNCKEHFKLEEMDADHIVLWKDGGKTNDENCQVLCVPCNRGG